MIFVIVHIYQHIIYLCSGFNFSSDSGLYRIPKILLEFWISEIPVASLMTTTDMFEPTVFGRSLNIDYTSPTKDD